SIGRTGVVQCARGEAKIACKDPGTEATQVGRSSFAHGPGDGCLLGPAFQLRREAATGHLLAASPPPTGVPIPHVVVIVIRVTVPAIAIGVDPGPGDEVVIRRRLLIVNPNPATGVVE